MTTSLRVFAIALTIAIPLSGCSSCQNNDDPAVGGSSSSSGQVQSSSAQIASSSSVPGSSSIAGSSSSSVETSSSAVVPSSSAAVVLTGIEVTPVNPVIAVDTSVQLAAVARYSDGSVDDVTAQATWSSSMDTTATVSTGGLVRGVAAGTASITAAFGGFMAMVDVRVSSAMLTSIVVAPPAPTLAAGTALQLTATGIFSDGTSQDLTTQVTWSSSDMMVATVDALGLLQAGAAGTATITAAFGGVSGTQDVTVSAATLSSLAITPFAPTVALGTTLQLTATGTFSDGTTQDLSSQVTWMSSDAMVATVDAAGALTPVAAGMTTVSASLGMVMDATMVTVSAATLGSISITPAAPRIAPSLTVQFVATGLFSDNSTQDVTAQVAWSSSDAMVVAISNAPGTEGLATGVAQGMATITAQLGMITATTTIEVSAAALVGITVTPVLPAIPQNTTVQFKALGTYDDGSTLDLTAQVTWTAADPAIASISNTAGTQGLATGLAPGSTAVTASLMGISDSTVLTVNAVTLDAIAVTPSTGMTAIGLTQQFTATGTYSDGSTQDVTALVTWSSSDATVATISNAGRTRGEATGVSLGSATITATLGMISGTATLTVTSAVITAITITPAGALLPRGSRLQLTATARWSDMTTTDVTTQVTWTSSDPTLVVVSNAPGSEGEATSVSPGQVTISATLGTITGTTTLRATNAALVTITITPNGATIARNTTLQFTATGTFSDGSTRVLGPQLTWSSSDMAVATIATTGGQRGLATGVAAGTTQIRASQDGVMAEVALVVSNTALVSIAITPDGAEVPVGFRRRLVATGTFDDGSTQDITALVDWSSSDAAIATVSNNANNGSRGRVTGVAAGMATITAASAGIMDTTAVTVTNATLTTVTVTPPMVMLAVNGTSQLAAQGTFSSGLMMDLTEQVTWASSDALLITVDNARGRQGRVRALAAGMVTITATAQNGVAGTASVVAQ